MENKFSCVAEDGVLAVILQFLILIGAVTGSGIDWRWYVRNSGGLMIVNYMLSSATCDDFSILNALDGLWWSFCAVRSKMVISTFDTARGLVAILTCVKVSLAIMALRRGGCFSSSDYVFNLYSVAKENPFWKYHYYFWKLLNLYKILVVGILWLGVKYIL